MGYIIQDFLKFCSRNRGTFLPKGGILFGCNIIQGVSYSGGRLSTKMNRDARASVREQFQAISHIHDWRLEVAGSTLLLLVCQRLEVGGALPSFLLLTDLDGSKTPQNREDFQTRAVKTHDCSTWVSRGSPESAHSGRVECVDVGIFHNVGGVAGCCRSKEAKYCAFSRFPYYEDLLLRLVFAPSLKKMQIFSLRKHVVAQG